MTASQQQHQIDAQLGWYQPEQECQAQRDWDRLFDGFESHRRMCNAASKRGATAGAAGSLVITPVQPLAASSDAAAIAQQQQQ